MLHSYYYIATIIVFGQHLLTEVHVAFHVVKIMHTLIYEKDLHSKNGACCSKVVDISVLGSSRRVQWRLLRSNTTKYTEVIIANIRAFSA